MWWKDMVLVVASSNNLKRGVISSFHDPPYHGHLGIANTYHLLKQEYWWPTVRHDTEEYVRGCAICQANKINMHHQKPHLFLVTTDPEAQPFKVVAMDFITILPLSNSYDSILTITDHYGIPRRLITDRGMQFISIFMRTLCKTLGIKQNISSAYHPQTDGQSERNNQWLKQYLWHWSNTQQDNWADLMPIAQFTHNSWPNTTTKHSPFKLLMGNELRMTWEERTTKVPSVDQRLLEIKEARDKAQ